MKIYKVGVIALLFCLATLDLGAQISKVDSLNQEFKKAKSDTTRCRILTAIIEEEGDDNIWPQYNDQLRGISEFNLKKHPKGDPLHVFYLKSLAASLSNEGYLANMQGDIPKALHDFQKSMKLEEQAGHKAGVAEGLNNLGSIYQYQGDIISALENYSKSLVLRQATRDQRGISESYNNLGLIYNELGDIPKALDYYEKGLAIQESIKDKTGISISLNNLGTLYQQQEEYDKALACYERSLKIQQEDLSNKQVLAVSMHNIGHIYEKQGNAEKALDYFDKSLAIAEESGNMAGMAHCLNSLGALYNKQGDLPKALNYWKKSFGLFETINDKQGMALTVNHLALGQLEQGKIRDAEIAAKLSLKLAQEIGFPENIKDASSTLNKIYTKTGNAKSAEEMKVLFQQMSDSTASVASRKAFKQKAFQFEYAQKLKADSIAGALYSEFERDEVKGQNSRRLGMIIGIAFILVLALFVFKRYKKGRE